MAAGDGKTLDEILRLIYDADTGSLTAVESST